MQASAIFSHVRRLCSEFLMGRPWDKDLVISKEHAELRLLMTISSAGSVDSWIPSPPPPNLCIDRMMIFKYHWISHLNIRPLYRMLKNHTYLTSSPLYFTLELHVLVFDILEKYFYVLTKNFKITTRLAIVSKQNLIWSKQTRQHFDGRWIIARQVLKCLASCYEQDRIDEIS